MAACGDSPAAPAPTGVNAVSVISVDVPNGGTAASDQFYVNATVQFQATSACRAPSVGSLLR
jgi:hypothetical protein